ncbi:MAG: transposase [Nodosilinea sp.]
MAPKKLTEADKQTILGLYHQPEQTTSTLAERYGVSNSTISRLLKASLPEAIYSALIQQKRSSVERSSSVSLSQGKAASPATDPLPSPRTVAAPVLKKRNPQPTGEAEDSGIAPVSEPVRLTGQSVQDGLAAQPQPQPQPRQSTPPDFAVGDLADAWPEDGVSLDDDYVDDEDYDEEDGEDEAWDREESVIQPQLDALEIYPLTAKALPPLCYLVVERVSSELVALPLRTFANLGQIPEVEGDSRTLPVFENHHIARRFSRRNQRVIKVPDGTLLQTTVPYLKAKGITRLLIDGQVFTLEDSSRPVE